MPCEKFCKKNKKLNLEELNWVTGGTSLEIKDKQGNVIFRQQSAKLSDEELDWVASGACGQAPFLFLYFF